MVITMPVSKRPFYPNSPFLTLDKIERFELQQRAHYPQHTVAIAALARRRFAAGLANESNNRIHILPMVEIVKGNIEGRYNEAERRTSP